MLKISDYAPLGIYCGEMPDFISEFANTAPMQRLKHIGMNCGSEYTAVHSNAEGAKYSRFEHSVGVALIVWSFTHNVKQAVAGLFHDISTPAFAHVVDYLNGDHMRQESTEAKTAEIIDNSQQLQALLKKYSLTTADVCDYHLYPIADNDSPMLSADRLEYTFGNFLHYKNGTIADIARYYGDLRVAKNEQGADEIAFTNPKIADEFALRSMKNSYVYIADTDRFTMQYLADLLKFANEQGVVSIDDLYTTEEVVIQKLCSNSLTAEKWQAYCNISGVAATQNCLTDRYCIRVNAKRRYLDPYVENVGRVTGFSEVYRHEVEKMLAVSFDNWLSAK